MSRIVVLLGAAIALCAFAVSVAAQGSERGRVPYARYPASLHDGGPAHRDFLPLPDGRLAVVNGQGLLVYDGARWRMFHHPGRVIGLRSCVLVPEGRVWCGFAGDIGYYEPEPTGDYVWRSQQARVPKEALGVNSIPAMVYDAPRDRVVLVTGRLVMLFPRRGDGAPTVLAAPESIGTAAVIDGGPWFVDTRQGLMRLVDDPEPRLEALPGGGALGPHAPVFLTRLDGAVYVLSAHGELHRYRDGQAQPIGEPHWPEWKTLVPSSLIALADGRLALGFRNGAPAIVGAEGVLEARYQELDSALEGAGHGVYEDAMGGLWVGYIGGMLRIDRASATTLFSRELGLVSPEVVLRWRGELYAGSSFGFFRMAPAAEGRAARFERVLPEAIASTVSVQAMGDRLVYANNGVFILDAPDKAPRAVPGTEGAHTLSGSDQFPDHLFVSTPRGVFDLRDPEREAPTLQAIPGSKAWSGFVHQVDADTLLVFLRDGEIGRSVRQGDGWSAPERVTDAIGLPSGARASTLARGVSWTATSKGLYRYEPSQGRYVQPPDLPEPLRTRALLRAFQDPQGNLWAHTDQGAGVAWRTAEGWRWDESPFRGLDRSAILLNGLLEPPLVWLVRTDSVVRIDLSRRRLPPPPPAPVLVRHEDLGARRVLPLAGPAEALAPGSHVRLAFALPTFLLPELNSYRSRLAGLESDWSEWSTRNEREFVSLPGGDYRFELEARDAFGRTSALPPWPITITTPWWRSAWALAAFALALALLLAWSAWLGARWRQRALLERQRELEDTVAHRTAELSASNARLAEQAERLLEVDRLKTRFFVNVGHEFRTPLTLVLGPLEDLLRDAHARLAPRVREQLELANRNARRVLELIVEILDVNRLEHGRLPPARTRLALDRLVEQAVDEARPLAQRHGHELACAIEGARPLEAELDPVQITRCLSNLIGNAAKFMPRGGRIEVTLARAEEGARIAVRDQGRGIGPEALPHVFDRFFQAEGSDGASGYGVGLALVRELVEGHGGRIEVESALGEGSMFTLTLPLTSTNPGTAPLPASTPMASIAAVPVLPESKDAPAPEEAFAVPAMARERPVVLVVDDHDDLRLRLRQLFEHDYAVLEASDGPGAWRAATEQLPDVIVCDVMMPGFDGIELTRRLRAHRETEAIALLLLTARAGSEHAVEGLRAGANDYLEKPFDSSELLARVDGLLAQQHRLRHQLARAPQPVAVVSPEPEAPTPDQRLRARLDAAIARYLGEPAFGIDQLARAVHLDRTQLFRRCKQLLGMSPSEYLRECRLARAHELLRRGAGSVSEIAYASGFESLSGFTRAFRARYGETPGTTRAERQAAR